jgi:hypothetical protein
MPIRVIALFLAAVLLWSGFSTIEASLPIASAPAPLHADTVGDAKATSTLSGSVEDHHLDDLPTQTQGDPGAENPGLLPHASVATLSLLAMPRPQFRSATARQLFLAGPLRPPCPIRSMA